MSVAQHFLENVVLGTPEVSDNIAHHVAEVHSSVGAVSQQYFETEKRYNYHKGTVAKDDDQPTMLLVHKLPSASEAQECEKTCVAFVDTYKNHGAHWDAQSKEAYATADAARPEDYFVYVLYRPRCAYPPGPC